MSFSAITTALLAAAIAISSFASAEPVYPTITPAPSPTRVIKGRQATTTYETTTPLPLTEYFYPISAVPYQVNPFPVERGPQSGYNQCNSTTEGPNALCQTLEFNSIEDFCIWGSATANEVVANVEAAMVAYCARSGHGGRIFPEGAISSLQFMRTPAYIQIVGFVNYTALNLQTSDPGGELDPHGADLFGNPLGGLVYSTGFSSGNNSTYLQTQSWNQFLDGNGEFCIKLCDPGYNTSLNYCQNIYDIIGCAYNMPADYQALSTPGVFISCEGDLQDEVGTYTSNGQTFTWSQPSLLPATSTLPWTPRVPASSNCVTYSSTNLFPVSLLGYQSSSASSVVSSTASGSASTSVGTAVSSSGSGSSAASSRSGTSSSSASAVATSKASGASRVIASTGFVGSVLLAGLFAVLL